MNFNLPLTLAIAAALVTACADPNRVLFVTTTQIGIDADSKSQSASIGYERYEGYVGPVYQNGGVAPVVARLESNLSITDPKISQLYATGDAARRATGGVPRWGEKPLNGNKKVMYFGTGTNFGLKATFSASAPSFNLGYKRQEFSLIPIGMGTKSATTVSKFDASKAAKKAPKPVDQSQDIYVPVLAAFDLNIANKSFAGTGAGVSQFFATGDAAENLAKRPDIQATFRKVAKKALKIREIKCQEKEDQASQQILEWLDKDTKHKTTLAAIVSSEFGADVTNYELIYCKDFAEKRLLVLERHNIVP
jgi:hypothetical protein